MSFYIADRTLSKGTDRKPEALGFIEGHTEGWTCRYPILGISPTLCLSIKFETDKMTYHTYKNLYGEVPHDMRFCSPDKSKFFMRDREIGDVIGEEMLLDHGQVIRLIWELLKWLVRGY